MSIDGANIWRQKS